MGAEGGGTVGFDELTQVGCLQDGEQLPVHLLVDRLGGVAQQCVLRDPSWVVWRLTIEVELSRGR